MACEKTFCGRLSCRLLTAERIMNACRARQQDMEDADSTRSICCVWQSWKNVALPSAGKKYRLELFCSVRLKHKIGRIKMLEFRAMPGEFPHTQKPAELAVLPVPGRVFASYPNVLRILKLLFVGCRQLADNGDYRTAFSVFLTLVSA